MQWKKVGSEREEPITSIRLAEHQELAKKLHCYVLKVDFSLVDVDGVNLNPLLLEEADVHVY